MPAVRVSGRSYLNTMLKPINEQIAFQRTINILLEWLLNSFTILWRWIVEWWTGDSSTAEKEIATKWVRSLLPNVSCDFLESWKDGILLCSLMESLLPGSCPRPELLDRTNHFNNVKSALDTLAKHFGPSELVTADDIVTCSLNSEKKLISYLCELKEKVSSLSFKACTTDRSTAPEVQACFAKGTGLTVGFLNRSAKIIAFCNTTVNLDLLVEIKSPTGASCGERFTNRSPKRKSFYEKLTKKSHLGQLRRSMSHQEGELINEDDIHQCNIETSHQELMILEYEILSDRVIISYKPIEVGRHRIVILWHGQHIVGSPFFSRIEDALKNFNEGNVIRLRPSLRRKNLEPADKGKKSCLQTRKPSVRFVDFDNENKHSGKVVRRKILRYIVKIGGADVAVEADNSEMLGSALLKLDCQTEGRNFSCRRNSWGFVGDVERKKSIVRQFCVDLENYNEVHRRSSSFHIDYPCDSQVDFFEKSLSNTDNPHSLKTVREGTDKGFRNCNDLFSNRVYKLSGFDEDKQVSSDENKRNQDQTQSEVQITDNEQAYYAEDYSETIYRDAFNAVKCNRVVKSNTEHFTSPEDQKKEYDNNQTISMDQKEELVLEAEKENDYIDDVHETPMTAPLNDRVNNPSHQEKYYSVQLISHQEEKDNNKINTFSELKGENSIRRVAPGKEFMLMNDTNINPPIFHVTQKERHFPIPSNSLKANCESLELDNSKPAFETQIAAVHEHTVNSMPMITITPKEFYVPHQCKKKILKQKHKSNFLLYWNKTINKKHSYLKQQTSRRVYTAKYRQYISCMKNSTRIGPLLQDNISSESDVNANSSRRTTHKLSSVGDNCTMTRHQIPIIGDIQPSRTSLLMSSSSTQYLELPNERKQSVKTNLSIPKGYFTFQNLKDQSDSSNADLTRSKSVQEMIDELENKKFIPPRNHKDMVNNFYSLSLNFPPLAANDGRTRVETRIRQWETTSSLPSTPLTSREWTKQAPEIQKLSGISNVYSKTQYFESIYNGTHLKDTKLWISESMLLPNRKESDMIANQRHGHDQSAETYTTQTPNERLTPKKKCIIPMVHRRSVSDPGQQGSKLHVPWISRNNSVSTLDDLSSSVVFSMGPNDESGDEYIDDEIPDYAAMCLKEYSLSKDLFRPNKYLPKSRADECSVFGAGIYYGHVAVKNHFQVLTKGAGKGNLSVSVRGSSVHDVTNVNVTYFRKDVYDVTYQVMEPGYYLISVKWSDTPVPGSPFLCKVTY